MGPRRWSSSRPCRGRMAVELRWFSWFVTLGIACFPGVFVVAITECSRHAPYFLSADQRAALCGQSDTSSPADCARKAHSAPGLSGSLVLELCSGATSDIPGVCVARLSRGAMKALPPELRVELCKDSHSDAPALCVELAIGFKRHPQFLVDVCKGASSVAPADCLNLLPRAVTDEMATRLCGRAQTAGPAICTSYRGLLSQTGLELTARLCDDAHGQGPAECFHKTALITKLSTEDRVLLCRGATTDAPARCAGDIRDHRLTSRERVDLCHGASSTAPARCLASVPPSVTAKDRVALCQGAAEPNPTSPAVCLKKILPHIPTTVSVTLCKGAGDSSAAECANSARHGVGDNDALVVLCRDASSTMPAECAKAAIRAGAGPYLAGSLCAAATSLAPASCFAAAPNQLTIDLRVEACSKAESTAPALCLAAAMPRGLRAKPGAGACPLDPEPAGGPPRRGLEHRLASRLCKNAIDDGPAECGRAAPLRMSDGDVENLCGAAGIPSGEATAHCAAAATMVGIHSADAASLCRGAGSDAPAVCAAVVAPRVSAAARVGICVGASSDAPARCVNSLPATRSPTLNEIEECRTIVPRPSGLLITSLSHGGKALFPGQPMQATLDVRDQWGGGMPTESSTVVRASIALRGSNGASVNAAGRSNTTNGGVVHFSHLSFTAAGNLTLQFSIDGKDGMYVPLAAAHVVVTETEHEAILRRCGSAFSSLSCPLWTERRHGEVNETGAAHSGILTEAVSIVEGGAVAAWNVLSCQPILEKSGVQVAIVSGGRQSLTAWLWYHPGIELMETGMGLPSRTQSAWERLGVDKEAGAREIRHAYYRQSLLWHPDRWVRYSMHSARAQEIFEIVGEAYAWLGKDTHGNQETSVDAGE